MPNYYVSSSATARLASAAASVNNTLVKPSPGVVYRVDGYNNNAAARFLKLYDKATAPVAGTDTPRKVLRLNPTSNFSFDMAMKFSAGIGYAITTGAPDNDTGALTSGDIVQLNIDYR